MGECALAAFGHPRYTGDLDFWIGTSPKNAVRVLAALKQFGFASLGITLDDLTTSGQVIQMGFPPRRIDLLTGIDGVEFDACYPRRLIVPVDGVNLNFIAIEDFKTNKRSTGRLKDLADLEALGFESP